LKIDRTALVALSGDAERSKNARLSARNIDDATLCRADQLTAFEMLNHRYLVIEKSELEAWLAGPSSQTDKAAKVEPMGRQPKKERRRREYKKRTHVPAGANPKPAGVDGEGE
ncbi:MAG: hypothetical protein AAGK04_01445, partial [Planctomycetota bacterium]